MPNTAVIGCQFGDEGKSKALDALLRQSTEGSEPAYKIVARYQGGCNAGHTQVRDGETYKLHLVPSGIAYPSVYNFDMEGIVLHPTRFVDEVRELQERGIEITGANLGVSARAHITLPHQLRREEYYEGGGKGVGSTMRGIATTYEDRAGRIGMRAAEFVGPNFEKILLEIADKQLERRLGGGLELVKDLIKDIKDMKEPRDFLREFVVDDEKIMRRFRNDYWLYEGAQSVGLDVGHGTYPFVTSSSAHNPPGDCGRRVGVVKVYLTRVGKGPKPSKIGGKLEEHIRKRGKEYGASTGRPRDCCWFDVPQGKYNTANAGITELAIIKLDVLKGLAEIPVCVGYKYKGSRLSEYPADRVVMDEVEPIFEKRKGWGDNPRKPINQAREPGDLPQEALDYVNFLSDQLETPWTMLSVGPSAEETIFS